jgi:catalase
MAADHPSDPLIKDLLDALETLFGQHPGFRPVHAKGIMCSGNFTPSADAAQWTKAQHALRPTTPVIVRLSDFAGVPTIPDNDPNGAGPRGMAVRFYLAEHIHTDLVCHSADAFPARNGEEFLAFARAIAASPPNAPKPTAIESFLAANPAAMRFVTLPKPIPTSFAHESFFGVSAFCFTNPAGARRHGRYRIVPVAGNEYLSAEEAAKKGPNFLMEEFTQRIGAGPVKFKIVIQIAGEGENVHDATAVWPAGRPQLDFGTITLTKKVNELDAEMRKMIFDPRPGLAGIEATDDPLFEVRAALYLMTGRRRRAASA